MTTIPYRLGKIKHRSLADEAYCYLKEQILSGHIRQGDVITEQTVADILHISRTPVKNALSRLESENFVTTLSGRGTLVNVLSIADMPEIWKKSAGFSSMPTMITKRTSLLCRQKICITWTTCSTTFSSSIRPIITSAS